MRIHLLDASLPSGGHDKVWRSFASIENRRSVMVNRSGTDGPLLRRDLNGADTASWFVKTLAIYHARRKLAIKMFQKTLLIFFYSDRRTASGFSPKIR